MPVSGGPGLLGGDLQRGGGSGTPSACSLSICRFADAAGLAAGIGAVAEAGLEEKRSEKPPGVCRNRAPAPPELLPLPVCLCVCLCVFVSVCLTTAPLPGRTAGCRSAVEEPRLPRRLCSPVSDLPLGDQWLLQVSGVSFSLPCRVDVPDLQGAANGIWVKTTQRHTQGQQGAWRGGVPVLPIPASSTNPPPLFPHCLNSVSLCHSDPGNQTLPISKSLGTGTGSLGWQRSAAGEAARGSEDLSPKTRALAK